MLLLPFGWLNHHPAPSDEEGTKRTFGSGREEEEITFLSCADGNKRRIP